ncbi:hypothetical protein HI914_04542 [Erysiphe necator]|nr:hypothetical protein HI914_04542 [Erysiphe necator]
MQHQHQESLTPRLLLSDEFVAPSKMSLSWKKAQAQPSPTTSKPRHKSPSGEISVDVRTRFFRSASLFGFFLANCFGIVTTQFVGCPLYLIDRHYYYAYMALTKRSFGIFMTLLTQFWAPTIIRISGDSSVAGQIQKTKDGKVQLLFPERLVMVANHQLYTDWLYLWWVAYANQSKTHGNVYIILKESLKHIPMVGWGMRFFSFIFLSRKLAVDEPRLSYRLRKLKKVSSGLLSRANKLAPMWLLLFPEGTNASQDGREKSASWAKKIGVKDLENTLLPRSAGSFFCLKELKGTVEYLYDCTIVYEGVKHGEFGQDNHTLQAMYLLGQPPPSVNMFWRRFAISDIPLHDKDEFDEWLRLRWSEKDAYINQYIATGRFPPILQDGKDTKNPPKNEEKEGFFETEVRIDNYWEILYIIVPILIFLGVVQTLKFFWNSGLIFNMF